MADYNVQGEASLLHGAMMSIESHAHIESQQFHNMHACYGGPFTVLSVLLGRLPAVPGLCFFHPRCTQNVGPVAATALDGATTATAGTSPAAGTEQTARLSSMSWYSITLNTSRLQYVDRPVGVTL